MVVRRTIHKLRERPKDERAAVAAAIAITAGAILFIGWAAYFFNSIKSTTPALPPAQQSQQAVASDTPDQFGSAGQLQLQQSIEATSSPYSQPAASWGN